MLTAAHRALSEQRGAGPSVALLEPEPLSTHRHLHLAFHSESPLDVDSSSTCPNPHSARETVTGGFVQEITRPASHSGHGPGSREVSLGCGADLFPRTTRSLWMAHWGQDQWPYSRVCGGRGPGLV